ncbi:MULTISPECIES: ATP-binding protein [Roseomonadaceae]|uniref:ATP-binding protein n=1 Tax=Falsiroseomonas oleicola TaxID=2801474 RepID=A0ABS6HA73_9PROT|nr:ATP-binding protein [Roseomonas oleicola]MBU8545604.1 ATP-binding protein [Roseomonas oleicola]
MIRLHCARDPEAVEGALDAIEAHLTAAGAEAGEAMQLRLVAEEIVTNIARCAWPQGIEARFQVELLAEPGPEGLLVRLTTIDDGQPFDPTAQDMPDVEAELEDRAIGGLGMFLVREMTDAQIYARESGENRFHVERLFRRAD